MADFLISGREYLAKNPGFELIGREEELGKLCSILVRRNQNSVLLVGPSGAGATALCLGLQAMKHKENAPFDIVSKSLFWLDSEKLFGLGSLQDADAGFRAAFKHLEHAHEPVLVIEDAGDFLDACRNNGTQHFINMLNKAIKDRKLQVIFEANDGDVEKVLRFHSDIREEYTILDIPEPTGQTLKAIVSAAAAKLVDFHEVAVDPDAVHTAIELTEKYRATALNSAAQPKRAISLLDRSLAGYRLDAHATPPKAKSLKAKIDAGMASPEESAEYTTVIARHVDLQAKLGRFHREQRDAEALLLDLRKELEAVRENRASSQDAGVAHVPSDAGADFRALLVSRGAAAGMDSPEAAKLTSKIRQHEEIRDAAIASYRAIANEMNKELCLGRAEILVEFSKISGISVNKLGEDALLVLKNLEAQLKGNVFGQDHAVEKVANAIKVSRIGRRNKNKPQAVYLFLGPSGTGKTELAKQIAIALLGDAKSLTRFDMSEYMEKHASAKLIGAPPGYEGFEAGGILTNMMRANRNRVILFDEIEKADKSVFDLFLQILDEGRLTDNIGRTADFSDAIIIMTTNLGQAPFLRDGTTYEMAMEEAAEELNATYRPEFLNRFNGRQNIIGFNKLELPVIERITGREISDLVTAYASLGVGVHVGADTISALCADRYDPEFGARGLLGIINTDLEPLIVNALIEHGETSGANYSAAYDVATRKFTLSDAAAAATAA